MTTSTEMKADIQARIIERPMREIPNPELLPSFFNYILGEVSKLADDGILIDSAGKDYWSPPAQDWANDLLRDMWHRAKAGVPYGEPPEHPYERVLSDGDGDLG